MHRSAVFTALLLLATPPAAEAQPSAAEANVFLFTGRFLDENMGGSLRILSAEYEDNYITGLGAQDFEIHTGIVSIGYELGLAPRYGQDQTLEVWGGIVGRIDDIRLLDRLYLSPSLIFGLSWVSDAHEGREKRHAAEAGGDARLLFYLSPELDFRTSLASRYSVFYRLQHRSGAWKTLGDMEGASNANVVGLRVRF